MYWRPQGSHSLFPQFMAKAYLIDLFKEASTKSAMDLHRSFNNFLAKLFKKDFVFASTAYLW